MLSRRLRAYLERWFRGRITRSGALFLLTVLVTGATAFLSGNNLLFLIFSATIALLLISGLISRLVLSGLELELLLPEHVAARTATSARIRLRNLKRLTPSFSVELSGRPDPISRVPSILRTPLYFPIVPGRRALEAPAEIMFALRGRHRENLFAISTRFPFGFFQRTAMVPLRRETIVYPCLEPGYGDLPLLEQVSGDTETTARGEGLDFYRIRPYEFTDSARLVDWKTTAHTGSLQVREFAEDRRRAVEIYLDRAIPSDGSEWFERAIERCAFLAWSLTERGHALVLRWQRAEFSVPEETDIFAVLRHLALVQPIGAAVSPEDVDHPFETADVSIAFTLRPVMFEEAGWTAAAASGNYQE